MASIGLSALALGGCLGGASSADEATFACARGFRSSDWHSPQKLKTGQSIAKCGWLEGWSQTGVRRVLGRPDFGTPYAPEYVLPGGAEASERLQEWILKLRFNRKTRRLDDATTVTMNV